MAKTATLTTIVAGFASAAAYNSNFANLNTALENTLSLDGSTPNAMGADFDLNNTFTVHYPNCCPYVFVPLSDKMD